MAPFRYAQPKQRDSSSSEEEEAEEQSSEGEEAELEKYKISTSVPKKPSSDSDSDSDSQPRPDPKSKPISPKPMVEDPLSKKAAPKKKASGVEEMPKKKQLFDEHDEIVILTGMIKFKSEKEVEPMSDMNGFLEFVKKLLRFGGATKLQMYEKVRRMRQKYENNVRKGKNNGGDFSEAHEGKAFDLSKNIWGSVGLQKGGEKRKGREKRKVERMDAELEGGEKSEVEKMKVDAKVEASAGGFWSGGFCGSVGGLSSGEKIVKYGLGWISDAEKVKLEGKWKKLRVEEVELFVKRLDLIHEQTEMVLEAMKSKKEAMKSKKKAMKSKKKSNEVKKGGLRV